VQVKKRGPLTGHEIQAIIHQSAQSNVREIDLPGLRLKFGEGGPAKDAPAPSLPPETTSPAGAANPEEPLTQEQLELMEAEAKEERLALMAIEDPLQFEQLVIAGELTDEVYEREEA
jgi:hypothetical protein